MKLDGTETPKPTPFDATEQVVRGPHTFVPVANASVEAHEAAGYKADPDFEPAEYPKAVDHVNVGGFMTVTGETVGGHLEPVIANSADHEAALTAPAVAEDAAHEEELPQTGGQSK